MFTAPHHLAAQTGLTVLREGGNAVEAMVAAAATVAVVYPHMNALGGDGFWLIHLPGQGAPIAIRACGFAGAKATPAFYRAAGCDAIPFRGPLAANTVAGAIDGWREALAVSSEIGGTLSLERLLEEAIHYAEDGAPVTESQRHFTTEKGPELNDVPGFKATFAPGGAVPERGALFKLPALAGSLKTLAAEGLDDFYRGALGRRIAAELARVGSPVTAEDLAGYRAQRVEPLVLETSVGRVYNHPPPTQGLTSLMILGLFDQLGIAEAEGVDYLHAMAEATKASVVLRDELVTDPGRMRADPQNLLRPEVLAAQAQGLDRERASPWPRPDGAGGGIGGDTIWMGAVDASGLAVSFIQSIYWDFGSGLVLEDSGILWQNRGASFQLAPGHLRELAPGRMPFHTLNPALATLNDGRVMTYGCMGGEGQPQTQAAIFSRIMLFGQEPQAALTAPRWLLGKTWGEGANNLKLEARFDPAVVAALRAAGHEVETIAPFSDDMGHGGAIVLRPDGVMEGAGDPRSDGGAVGF